MIDLGALATAALVLLLGAASPGPSLAVVARNTLSGGRGQGIACAVGHGFGFGLYATVAVFGLHTLMAQATAVFVALQVLGVVLLIYMAIDLLRPAGQGNPEAPHEPTQRTGFVEGFLIALFNPKIALFFLAVFANVLHADMGGATLIAMASVGFVIDTGWYALIAALLSTQSATAWLRAQGRHIDYAMAAIFIALAVATLLRLIA